MKIGQYRELKLEAEDTDAGHDAEPPVNCDPPPLEESRMAVNKIKCRKVPAHSVVFYLEHDDHPTDYRRGVVVPIWEKMVKPRCITNKGYQGPGTNPYRQGPPKATHSPAP